jgi:hypothetical protein
MSQIHVLHSVGPNLYHVVVHGLAPAGNNRAGVAWSTAIKNAGLAKSQMVKGPGPGQITEAENNAVNAGTTLEGSFQWRDDPNWDAATRKNDILGRADQLIADLSAHYQEQLGFFGYVEPAEEMIEEPPPEEPPPEEIEEPPPARAATQRAGHHKRGRR